MPLFLIRHAHTQVHSDVDAVAWALSAQGQTQAVALARAPFWQQVDCIALSREPKTRLTIEPVLALFKLPTLVDAHFDELRRAGWTEDYAAQVAQAFAEPQMPAGEWESAADALKRFLAGVEALVENHPNQTIALVGHGLTLSLYRAHLQGQATVHLADWQKLPFAAVAVVDPAAHRLVIDFHSVIDQSKPT